MVVMRAHHDPLSRSRRIASGKDRGDIPRLDESNALLAIDSHLDGELTQVHGYRPESRVDLRLHLRQLDSGAAKQRIHQGGVDLHREKGNLPIRGKLRRNGLSRERRFGLVQEQRIIHPQIGRAFVVEWIVHHQQSHRAVTQRVLRLARENACWL